MRDFLTLRGLGADSLASLLDRVVKIADGQVEESLRGKVVGIYFRKMSTRTRSSFSVGAMNLGANVMSYGPHDLQIETGETIGDTARVLGEYLDGLVIRTNGSDAEMEEASSHGNMAVINAMSETEHPTQAIGDMGTIYESFGRFEDIHVLYSGEGNNTASALGYAVAQTPNMRLTLATPEGYGLPEGQLREISDLANKHGSRVEQTHSVADLSNEFDVVYATRWHTMGVAKPESDWEEKFAPFKVSEALMSQVSRSNETIFMHDLPAVRGQDVDDEVLDGPRSRAWRQSKYKLLAAMAILEWCLLD